MNIQLFESILLKQFEVCQIFRPQIPAGINAGFAYFYVESSGRKFYLRLTFDKSFTACEVVLEEYLGKNALNLLFAHYAVETSINDIVPIDVTTFDKTVLDIIKKVEYAYKNS